MRKAELRKLRALNATKEMMQKANDEKWQQYKLFLRVQNLGPYMKIAIFRRREMQNGIKTPRYELFLNVTGNEYITRELDDQGKEVRWSTAMILNLPLIDAYWWSIRTERDKAFINQDAMRSIGELPMPARVKDCNYKGILRIHRWQENIREQNIIEQEKREQKPWDEDMELVGDVPNSFMDWLKKEIPEKNYIFYQYDKKGAKQGWCRHCNQYVDLKVKPKHRLEVACPRCRRKSEYISIHKIGKVWSDFNHGIYMQKINGGMVVREFWVRYSVCTNNFQYPEYATGETRRTLYFANRTVRNYQFGLYKNKYNRWIPEELPKRYYWASQGATVYRKNIRSLEALPQNKDTALFLMLRQDNELEINRYMFYEKRFPIVEKLVKANFPTMLKEVLNSYGNYMENLFDLKQKELAKALKLDNARMKRLKAGAGSSLHLEWLQREKREDTQYPDEMLQYFVENKLGTKTFDFIEDRMSLVKAWHYLQKQIDLCGQDADQTVRTWEDYLNMAKHEKMDVSKEMIYKPKNLKMAHDEMIELREQKGMDKLAKEIRKKFKTVNDVCQSLEMYEYADDTYSIIAPKDIKDIVREGTLLKHCIHTCDYYFDRIQRRESYLLFLRKNDCKQAPWYTLEVEPGGNIRQKRTVGDNQNKDLDAAVPFLQKWQQVIQKRMTEKEKKLAKISDAARKENIKTLRKNQNKIWHGKLQGLLLADVLEQDFMEVM